MANAAPGSPPIVSRVPCGQGEHWRDSALDYFDFRNERKGMRLENCHNVLDTGSGRLGKGYPEMCVQDNHLKARTVGCLWTMPARTGEEMTGL